MTENKAGPLAVIGTAFRRWIIQRRQDCCAIAAVLLLIVLAGVPRAKAQSRGNSFEWPTYGADLANTRYRPLDQINASNFNKLEVAWTFKTDNLGPRPEYKLEGTPLMVGGVVYATAGTRRAVVALDAATGELLWMHSENEGERGAAAPRRLSGRGLAYWSSGNESRVLYVTPGYRLIALDAKTGVPDPGFGENGVVDLKVGAQVGTGDQIDLVKGEIGLHATPVVANDEIIVGAAFRDGLRPKTHNNTKGCCRSNCRTSPETSTRRRRPPPNRRRSGRRVRRSPGRQHLSRRRAVPSGSGAEAATQTRTSPADALARDDEPIRAWSLRVAAFGEFEDRDNHDDERDGGEEVELSGIVSPVADFPAHCLGPPNEGSMPPRAQRFPAGSNACLAWRRCGSIDSAQFTRQPAN